MSRSQRDSSRPRSPLFIIGCLLASASFVYAAFAHRAERVAETSRATAASLRAHQQPVDRKLQPIETLRVGDRVLAKNPEISESERSTWKEPAAGEWLRLKLELPKQNGTTLQVEMLRPEAWLQAQIDYVVQEIEEHSDPDDAIAAETAPSPNSPSAVPEDTADETAPALVPLSPLRPLFRDLVLSSALLELGGYELAGLTVELDLPEMGAVGTAVITDILPCPKIAPGEGQVITATFKHPPSTEVLDVTFEGESQPIGVTENHLFWSADRQQFVEIGTMSIGERVQTYQGDTKRIESKLPRPGPQHVYNLEVYGEHTYFVGDQGLLVHNQYQAPRIGGTGPDYNKQTGQGLYVLLDDVGDVRYVGRGDAPARLARHAQSDSFGQYRQVILRNNDLTKAQARGLENLLIGKFGGAASVNSLTNLRNRIRSFSPLNGNALSYRNAVSPQLVREVMSTIRAARRSVR